MGATTTTTTTTTTTPMRSDLNLNSLLAHPFPQRCHLRVPLCHSLLGLGHRLTESTRNALDNLAHVCDLVVRIAESCFKAGNPVLQGLDAGLVARGPAPGDSTGGTALVARRSRRSRRGSS